MQKFIPMVDGLFNGGAGREPLLGTDEQIAAFFRRPEGYKYALMDTMYDLVVDLVGAAIMTMICYMCMKSKKVSIDAFVITKEGDDKADKANATATEMSVAKKEDESEAGQETAELNEIVQI